jgi:hypothetical protein
MDGEQKILESGDGDFVVSSHRVRMTKERLGSSEHTTIPIDSVTSYEVDYESNPLLLGLALVGVVAVVWGLVNEEPGSALVGGFVTTVLTLLFFYLRERTLSISSPTESIDLKLEGVSLDEAVCVIEDIEEARRSRLEQLNGQP